MSAFDSKRPPSVLVVDDEKDMLSLYSAILEVQGMKVDCVENGTEADFKLNRTQYDLIITDINMPYTDGVTFVKNLKKGLSNTKTPIIVVSGYLSKQTILRLAKYGVTKIFSKPIQIQKFAEFVNQTIDFAGDLSKLGDIKTIAQKAPPPVEVKDAEDPEEFEVA